MTSEQKLLETLSQGTEKILAYVEATEGFAAEQAPLVVEEILRWGFYENLYSIAWGLFVMGLAYFITYAAYKIAYKLIEDHSEFPPYAIGFMTAAAMAFPFFISLVNIYWDSVAMLKVLISPRLYLLETLSNLLT